MARPPQYPTTRVDTKVRLRADHARLLTEAQEERQVGRNRLIEMALDQFFQITPHGPRLTNAPKDPQITQAAPRQPTRTSPRLSGVGKAMEAQSENATTQRRTP